VQEQEIIIREYRTYAIHVLANAARALKSSTGGHLLCDGRRVLPLDTNTPYTPIVPDLLRCFDLPLP
jgi:hypothetical protein